MRTTAAILIALLVAVMTAQAGEVTRFDLNHYAGWTYSRPGVTLTTAYIGNNQVRLFKPARGEAYTLTSPTFSCGGASYLQVKTTYLLPTAGESQFSLTKASPTFELLDPEGKVVASKTLLLSRAAVSQTLTALLPVPQGATPLRLRVACWNADKDSPGCIKALEAGAFASMPGDLNGDNAVNAADVTALVTLILDVSQ